MERPDLTYLTQADFELQTIELGKFKSFVVLDKKAYENIFAKASNRETVIYAKAISKLPELVQCAEMHFDMTLDKPNSIIHKMVSDLLNELKEEK